MLNQNQKLKFLTKKYIQRILNEKYIIISREVNKKYSTIFITNDGVFSLENKLESNLVLPQSLNNTIIKGEWHNNCKNFIANDIILFCGRDVSKKSYLVRINIVKKIICKYIPFCKLVEYYENYQCIEKLFDKDIIFVPNYQKYRNNHTFLYRMINNVYINFSISSITKFNFNFYILKSGENNVIFKGTKHFPFNSSSIPLTLIEQKIIGDDQNYVYKLLWVNNNFMVYQRMNSKPSSEYYTKCIWNYINNYIDKYDLLYYLKEQCY